MCEKFPSGIFFRLENRRLLVYLTEPGGVKGVV